MRALSIAVMSLFLAVGSVSQALEVGDTVSPSARLTLKGMDGNANSIEESIVSTDKRYVILDFMSIYCGYCVRNLPTIQKLTEMTANVATVRSITLDRNPSEVVAFFTDAKGNAKYDFSVMFDSSRGATRIFGIRATPTLFILDESGEIIYKHLGLLGASDVEEILVEIGLE